MGKIKPKDSLPYWVLSTFFTASGKVSKFSAVLHFTNYNQWKIINKHATIHQRKPSLYYEHCERKFITLAHSVTWVPGSVNVSI